MNAHDIKRIGLAHVAGRHISDSANSASFAALDASATAEAREEFFVQADLSYSRGSTVREAIRYTNELSAQITAVAQGRKA